MFELSIFYDEECTKPVRGGKITVDTVRAGEPCERILYFRNNIDKHLDINIGIISDDLDVTLLKRDYSLLPNEIIPIMFLFNPRMERETAISVELKLDVTYML